MESLFFIVNPISNGGKTANLLNRLKEAVKEVERAEIRLTSKPEEATKLAIEAVNSGFERIIAVGGDGTINEVAKGLSLAKGGSLGIIPSGTGNDMIKTFGWTKDFDENIQRVLHGKIKQIDYGMANEKFFINIASIGFDALVVKETNKIKTKIRNAFAYVLGLIISLAKYKNQKMEYHIDGETTVGDNFLFAVGNGRVYGGGFKILPQANVDDGFLDVVIARNISKLKILTVLPSLLNGSHLKKKAVEVYKLKSLRVNTKVDYILNIDGELFEMSPSEVEFKIVEKGLNLIY